MLIVCTWYLFFTRLHLYKRQCFVPKFEIELEYYFSRVVILQMINHLPTFLRVSGCDARF